MKFNNFWKFGLGIILTFMLTGCAVKYPTHLYQSTDIKSETMSLVLIKSPLIPLSMDGHTITYKSRGGRAWEVLKINPGSHSVEVKYYSKNFQSHYGGSTTTTTTAGPWKKSIDAKPGYIYIIESDNNNKNNTVKTSAYEAGPIKMTSPDGNYEISLKIPDVSGEADFQYIIKNNTTQEIKTYPLLIYPNQKPIFSPDKKRMAFGPEKKDEKYSFVVDGVKESPFEKYGYRLFSPDSKVFVYDAKINNKWYVVANGVQGKPYDNIWGSVKFSPNGEKMGYIAEAGGKYTVVIDGNEGSFYDKITTLRLSEDGASVAYIAKKGDKELIVINGKEEPLHEKIWFHSFSPDGKKCCYSFVENSKECVVINGSTSKPYDEVWKTDFSDNGNRYCYVARSDQKKVVVIDGKESEPYDKAYKPKFSPDETKVAYIAEINGKEFVVINGEKTDSYDSIRDLTFSKDGKLTYEVKENDKWELLIKDFDD